MNCGTNISIKSTVRCRATEPATIQRFF